MQYTIVCVLFVALLVIGQFALFAQQKTVNAMHVTLVHVDTQVDTSCIRL
jgi:hypothetical protein